MKTLAKNKIFLSGEIIELENRYRFLNVQLGMRKKTDCQIEKIAEELNIISKRLRRARRCTYNEQHGWCDSYSRKLHLKVEKATKFITEQLRAKRRA